MSRQTAVKTPVLIPQPNGGALLSGGKPGNKGGGRVREYVEERAAELLTDKQVWDVQLARAKCGDGRVIDRALEIHGITKTGGFAAAQLETPDGFKFSLILGERDGPDD